MAETVYNAETKEALRLDGGDWVPTEVLSNEAGEIRIWDGGDWISPSAPATPVEAAPQTDILPPQQPEFTDNNFDGFPDDGGLSVEQYKRGPVGDAARLEAYKPKNQRNYINAEGTAVYGEPPDERQQRLYGSIPERDIGLDEGVGRAAIASLGGDELTALLSAAGRKIGLGPNRTDPNNPQDRATFGEMYNLDLENERQKTRDFRKSDPFAAYPAEIGGVVAAALAGPSQAAVTTPGRLVKALTVGAGEGSAIGFGAGEGGLAPRTLSAVPGFVLGGAGGALSVPVSSGLGMGVRGVSRWNAARQAGVSPAAHRLLTEALNADNTFTGQGAANLARAGDEAMVADSGPSAQRILDTAIQSSGPAGALARDLIEGRATRSNQIVTEAMDDALGGPPQGVRLLSRESAAASAPARREAYDAAYAEPVNYANVEGQAINAVLDRIPPRILQKAINDANERMQLDGLTNQQIMITVDDVAGTVKITNPPNVQQLDQIKRALQREARLDMDPVGRPGQWKAPLNKAAAELRDAIGRNNSDYRAAVELGSDKIAMDEALDIGRRLMTDKVSMEDIAEAAGRFNVVERQQVAKGVRSAMDDALAKVQRAVADGNMEAREAMKAVKLFSSRANQDKLRRIIGDDAADIFFAKMEKATTGLELRASVADNSGTFARQVTQKRMDDVTQGGAINALRNARPLDTTRELAATAMGRSGADIRRINDETASELVRALVGPRGQKAGQALQRLTETNQVPENAALASRNLSEMLLRAMAPAPGVRANSDMINALTGRR